MGFKAVRADPPTTTTLGSFGLRMVRPVSPRLMVRGTPPPRFGFTRIMPEQYCPECGRPVSRWTPPSRPEIRWRCDVHGGIENALYLGSLPALEQLVEIYRERPPKDGPMLANIERRLERYCWGCRSWKTTEGDVYYCDVLHFTGKKAAMRPDGCPGKA